MTKNCILLFLLVSLISCGTDQRKNDELPQKDSKTTSLIDTLSWLIGDWENANENGVMTESWKKTSDKVLDGTVTGTYFLPENPDSMITDTLETIRIEEQFGQVRYIPAVKDQNQGLPVSFTMTSNTRTRFIFENPQHDFPTKIMYERIGEDSLIATVSGIYQGVATEDVFHMKRK